LPIYEGDNSGILPLTLQAQAEAIACFAAARSTTKVRPYRR
jgi:hypothetical protein